MSNQISKAAHQRSLLLRVFVTATKGCGYDMRRYPIHLFNKQDIVWARLIRLKPVPTLF